MKRVVVEECKVRKDTNKVNNEYLMELGLNYSLQFSGETIDSDLCSQ